MPRLLLSAPVFRHFAICVAFSLPLLSASGQSAASCGDGVINPGEQCDDGNGNDLDGCTSLCRSGATCDVVARPGADAFAVDASSGRCYSRFDAEVTTFQAASAACAAQHGHLASVTDVNEQSIVANLVTGSDVYWIGAIDDANSTDESFTWLTGEPWAFTAFAPGQPDDDVVVGGGADCLALTSGGWVDTSCVFAGYVTGRFCEFEPSIFLDGFES